MANLRFVQRGIVSKNLAWRNNHAISPPILHVLWGQFYVSNYDIFSSTKIHFHSQSWTSISIHLFVRPQSKNTLTTMSTFILDGFENPVDVELTDNITQEQLLDYEAFQTWRSTMIANLKLQTHSDHPFYDPPFSLRKITIQSVDWAEKRLLFIKLQAKIVNAAEQELPSIAFSGVAVLPC